VSVVHLLIYITRVYVAEEVGVRRELVGSLVGPFTGQRRHGRVLQVHADGGDLHEVAFISLQSSHT
jgi:hypothetical protein